MREAVKERMNDEEIQDDIKNDDYFWAQFDYKPMSEILKEPPRYTWEKIQSMKLLCDAIGVELPQYTLRTSLDKEYFWDVINVRPCKEKDLPGVMALDREAFPDPWSRESWLRELNMKNPISIWYVAEVKGRIAGFAGVWVSAGEAQLMKIAVKEEVRNQGVGEYLLTFLIDQSEFDGAETMTLEVRESNIVAQKFYEHCEFVSLGIRPGYYSDTHEGAVIMRRDYPVEELAELMRDKGCNYVIPVT